MSNYHEPPEILDDQTKEFVRALNSLKEEIEAVDWYNQRVSASKDTTLKEIMAHNRDEEMEHAVMTLEWLRRNMDGWDEQMRTYLFKDDPILDLEETDDETSETTDNDLNIGDLK